jgi:C1A family cysteine protease
MKLVVFSLLLISVATEVTETELFNKYQDYLQTYQKTYGSIDEMTVRYDVFKQNYIKAAELNAESGVDIATTKYMTMTPNEFKKKMLTLDIDHYQKVKARTFGSMKLKGWEDFSKKVNGIAAGKHNPWIPKGKNANQNGGNTGGVPVPPKAPTAPNAPNGGNNTNNVVNNVSNNNVNNNTKPVKPSNIRPRDSTTNTPSNNTPTNNNDVPEVNEDNTPSNNNNTPSNNTPSNNTPSNNTPSNNTPSNNTPSNNTPSSNTPSNITPSSNTPSDNTVGDVTDTTAGDGSGMMLGASITKAPKNWDWRKQGAVLKTVYEQGECNACWTFSSAANIEGVNFIKNGVLTPLSQQQLVDCDTENNNGCNGGSMQNAFDYLKDNGGIQSYSDYKYTGRQGSCKFNPDRAVVQVTGWVSAGTTDEKKIRDMLYQRGPLSVAVNAVPLQYYTGGIADYSHAACDPNGTNHAVTLVGYGTQNGKDFWIVKNSWGADWGEKGYFRIARGKGTCGINTYVVSSKVN